MRLSTRGYYGLKAMYDLARHYGQGPISLKSVAERQNISGQYLEQLIGALRKGGLVNSVRGAQGGYILARPPSEIRVGDIIRILEGPIAPIQCVSEVKMPECERADCCITRTVWQKVRDSITQVIDTISLADMCEEEKKSNRNRE